MQIVGFFDGSAGGCDCLGEYLATEYVFGIVILTTLEIFFDPLDVDQIDYFGKYRVHERWKG